MSKNTFPVFPTPTSSTPNTFTCLQVLALSQPWKGRRSFSGVFPSIKRQWGFFLCVCSAQGGKGPSHPYVSCLYWDIFQNEISVVRTLKGWVLKFPAFPKSARLWKRQDYAVQKRVMKEASQGLYVATPGQELISKVANIRCNEFFDESQNAFIKPCSDRINCCNPQFWKLDRWRAKKADDLPDLVRGSPGSANMIHDHGHQKDLQSLWGSFFWNGWAGAIWAQPVWTWFYYKILIKLLRVAPHFQRKKSSKECPSPGSTKWTWGSSPLIHRIMGHLWRRSRRGRCASGRG